MIHLEKLPFGPVAPVTITDGGRDEISFTQALWYAWGAQDNGVKLPRDAMEFARDYATELKAFHADRQWSAPSVQHAFRNWLEGKPLNA